MGLPCDALPMHAARLSFGGSRSIGWAWPCAGPRPAEPVIQMAKVLWKIGQGRSEAEIERALLQR
jgi:hypothetical protein